MLFRVSWGLSRAQLDFLNTYISVQQVVNPKEVDRVSDFIFRRLKLQSLF